MVYYVLPNMTKYSWKFKFVVFLLCMVYSNVENLILDATSQIPHFGFTQSQNMITVGSQPLGKQQC